MAKLIPCVELTRLVDVSHDASYGILGVLTKLCDVVVRYRLCHSNDHTITRESVVTGQMPSVTSIAYRVLALSTALLTKDVEIFFVEAYR